MAFFECTIGGASGDGVALIVQCDANFAGSTITADNGEDVFSEICPSVSPYTVRFEGIPTGTYTISGVSQGQTFTTQFTVLDYETTLTAIPEGATVTPVNDIQIWLHCANIWDKNYTSISQVLADASTLQALIASNNAADYMARSTSWANSVTANANAMTYIGANNYCANKLLANSTWRTAICNSTYIESVLNVKVPTMTSNTTPSGQAICGSDMGSPLLAYKAFMDTNDANNRWVSARNSLTDWVGYTFTRDVTIYKIVILDMIDSNSLRNLTMTFGSKLASETDYTPIYTTTATMVPTTETSYVVSTVKKGRSTRVHLSGTSGEYCSVMRLQFYGRA